MSDSIRMPTSGMRWALSFGIGIIGIGVGGIVSYTTQSVLVSEDRKQIAARFEAVDKDAAARTSAVTDRFDAIAKDREARTTAMTQRFEALDRDRDTRTAAINAKLEAALNSINLRFDNLDKREENRSDRVNALDGRLNRVEAQIPILGSLRR